MNHPGQNACCETLFGRVLALMLPIFLPPAALRRHNSQPKSRKSIDFIAVVVVVVVVVVAFVRE